MVLTEVGSRVDQIKSVKEYNEKIRTPYLKGEPIIIIGKYIMIKRELIKKICDINDRESTVKRKYIFYVLSICIIIQYVKIWSIIENYSTIVACQGILANSYKSNLQDNIIALAARVFAHIVENETTQCDALYENPDYFSVDDIISHDKDSSREHRKKLKATVEYMTKNGLLEKHYCDVYDVNVYKFKSINTGVTKNQSATDLLFNLFNDLYEQPTKYPMVMGWRIKNNTAIYNDYCLINRNVFYAINDLGIINSGNENNEYLKEKEIITLFYLFTKANNTGDILGSRCTSNVTTGDTYGDTYEQVNKNENRDIYVNDLSAAIGFEKASHYAETLRNLERFGFICREDFLTQKENPRKYKFYCSGDIFNELDTILTEETDSQVNIFDKFFTKDGEKLAIKQIINYAKEYNIK